MRRRRGSRSASRPFSVRRSAAPWRRTALVSSTLLAATACTDLLFDVPDDPGGGEIYQELWDAFDRRYAPFEARGVDWRSAGQRHRPAEDAGPDALFEASTSLLAGLDDGHVTLVAPGRAVFVAQRSFREQAYQRHFDIGLVQARMVEGPFRSGAARYGILDGGVGYLHVADWSDPIPEPDAVVELLRRAEAIIVDLRHNPGGDFRNGFELAARFADRRRLAFSTWTKTGPGHDDLGQHVAWHIEPGGPAPVLAQVVVLTNGYTNSAAERTLLAFRTLPHVTVVGSPTAGNQGEKVGGELSNGWLYTFVPQIVKDPDGATFEGRGIPPDVRVDNSAAEVADGLDRQLEVALDLLVGRQ